MDNDSKQGTVLTDPVLIGIMLEKARNSHSLLTVSVPSNNEEFLSLLLNINDATGQIIIDELKPAAGNITLKRHKLFNAYSKLQGVSIAFQSRYIKTIRKGSLTSICAEFPVSMQHHERRSSHRVPVAIGLDLYANIYDNGKPAIRMRVTDISAEGIGLSTKSEIFQQLTQSKNEIRCTLMFPDEEEEWNVRIELCSSKRPSSNRTLHFGAFFKELTTKQNNILTRMLRLIDRENIRRDSRY